MRKIVPLILAVLMIAAAAATGFAGVFNDKCALCHSAGGPKGMAKTSKADMLKKYKTIDELVAGANEANNPMMKESLQGNEKLIRDAARDIGLK